VQLRVAEQYVEQFGNLARTTNTVILPATLSDVGSMIAAATNVLRAATPPVAVRSTTVAPRPPPPPPGRPLPGT
jgi:hypothetical protein